MPARWLRLRYVVRVALPVSPVLTGPTRCLNVLSVYTHKLKTVIEISLGLSSTNCVHAHGTIFQFHGKVFVACCDADDHLTYEA